jgi:tetratricopeptide (TPR) repeat protein
MIQTIDEDSRATIAAANAQAALDRGDTARASMVFREAGEILEGEMNAAHDEETRQLSRFLAATQYYKGGHYQKARELARKIEVLKLPGKTKDLLPQFLRDVEERAAPDYVEQIHSRLTELWRARDYAGIIELLAEHQYVVGPGTLAYLRAVCCEELGDYRPAVLFFSDAARWVPDDPTILSALAPLPLHLAAHGHFDKAWEYVQAQLELFPNAVTSTVASLLYYHKARHAEREERSRLIDEQLRLFAHAREEFARLSDAHRTHAKMRAVMGLAYEAAGYALDLVGRKEEARLMADQAIAFDPDSPNAWALRGILTSDTPEEAAAAFRKAIELGDKTYFPHYYLAYYAITHGDYDEARARAQEALERSVGQNSEVRSLLYQWLAISRANLGAERSEVENLFKKAIEAAPGNESAHANYRHFQQSQPLAPPPLAVVLGPEPSTPLISSGSPRWNLEATSASSVV